jgi:hypothetical protein
MITYVWTIPTTDFSVDPQGNPDRINTIHWTCTATEENSSASAYGTIGVDMDFATTTEQMCIDAAKAENPDVESNLAAQLDTQAAPTSGSGRPWEYPPGTEVWMADKAYAVNDVVLYETAPYTCIQAHTSQRGWFPPAVPALWSIQGQPGGEWVPNELVEVGDVRTYQGTEYECIQAHTTQVGWEPPNVPALWTEVVIPEPA